MADDVIWSILNKQHCSFKNKLPHAPEVFCRNRYNLTGLCNRRSCPLSNSVYSTVIERKGIMYLYMKTAERKHTPRKLWEKIKLPGNYFDALDKVDELLQYQSYFQRHKCKQRLTKIRQMMVRSRKLKKDKLRRQMVTVHNKIERKHARRERRALSAAKLTNQIKSELLERLKTGTYQGVHSMNTEFQRALQSDDEMEELEQDLDDMDRREKQKEEQETEFQNYYEDLSDAEADGEDIWEETDGEDIEESDEEEEYENVKKSGPRVEIEFEEESQPRRVQTNQGMTEEW